MSVFGPWRCGLQGKNSLVNEWRLLSQSAELMLALRWEDNLCNLPTVFREEEKNVKRQTDVFTLFCSLKNITPLKKPKHFWQSIYLVWRCQISSTLFYSIYSQLLKPNQQRASEQLPLLDQSLPLPMSFQSTAGVGGTEPKANMAASLDNDFEFNNQDYYSLLNVRKEVRFVLFHVGTGRLKTFYCCSSIGFNWGSGP